MIFAHVFYLFNSKIQHARIFSFPGLLRLSWAMRIPCHPRASVCNHRETEGFGTAACNSSRWDEAWSGAEEQGLDIAGGYGTCITKGDGEWGRDVSQSCRGHGFKTPFAEPCAYSTCRTAVTRCEENASWWVTLPSVWTFASFSEWRQNCELQQLWRYQEVWGKAEWNTLLVFSLRNTWFCCPCFCLQDHFGGVCFSTGWAGVGAVIH